RDFFPLFYSAWQSAFQEKTILKAFEATGLSPFNPQVILQRFTTSTPLASLSDSDSSTISTSDWRKIERLLRQVVDDRGNKQVKRLSQVLHSNSVQNALLKHEVMSLREALVNERTRRKRGKALPLLEPEEYNGGAIVWSPRKVREARSQQQQQKLEEEQQKLQKAEAKRLRGDNRQAKAEAVQLRRQARAEARLLREKERAERAERAADQASRAAAHRTNQR
ncbi:hypothetical protein EJ02DRAFT_477157, partial [Clathrospora elynae]